MVLGAGRGNKKRIDRRWEKRISGKKLAGQK
ncbi:MAG: hypothetical protein QT01_C0003G0016 [archaeon GW2011_AR6]|nr:MAG: hypothetical protein QT01_C0003G0016 [archaeon GW2011_AR6]